MRLWAFFALFLASQASAGEWTGFRDATLGADISQLGGFRQTKDNLFARASGPGPLLNDAIEDRIFANMREQKAFNSAPGQN